MLLRSISKHVKDQNWFAVALDFLIVVVGILLAFQITNWNEARQSSEQQNLIELRLRSDFEFINQELISAEEYSKNIIVALDTLRAAINKGEAVQEEDERIKTAIVRGYSHATFVRHSPTYEELVSSGRLDLIKDEELRVALARYDEQAENRMFNFAQIRNIVDVIDLHLAKHAELAAINRNDIGISPVVKYDIPAMTADNDYRVKLDRLLNLMTWMHSNLVFQRKDVDTVLQAMEDSD